MRLSWVELSQILSDKISKNDVQNLESVDNSFSDALRPAACPRDPENLLNAQAYCKEIDRAGSRGQAAGRRDLNCQQPLTSILENVQALNESYATKPLYFDRIDACVKELSALVEDKSTSKEHTTKKMQQLCDVMQIQPQWPVSLSQGMCLGRTIR